MNKEHIGFEPKKGQFVRGQKTSETTIKDASGKVHKVVKGSIQEVPVNGVTVD